MALPLRLPAVLALEVPRVVGPVAVPLGRARARNRDGRRRAVRRLRQERKLASPSHALREVRARTASTDTKSARKQI